MRYRIKHKDDYYIVERKRWWGWQQLRKKVVWTMGVEPYDPPEMLFTTPYFAEEGLKTAIIVAGIRRAHNRVVREVPPWTKKA